MQLFWRSSVIDETLDLSRGKVGVRLDRFNEDTHVQYNFTLLTPLIFWRTYENDLPFRIFTRKIEISLRSGFETLVVTHDNYVFDDSTSIRFDSSCSNQLNVSRREPHQFCTPAQHSLNEPYYPWNQGKPQQNFTLNQHNVEYLYHAPSYRSCDVVYEYFQTTICTVFAAEGGLVRLDSSGENGLSKIYHTNWSFIRLWMSTLCDGGRIFEEERLWEQN